MTKRIMLSAAFLIYTPDNLYALNALDQFVMTRCGERCNGESEDCIDCYNQAVDLYDQSIPVSPNVDWGMSDGKFEFEF